MATSMTWDALERALGIPAGQRIYDQHNIWQLSAKTGSIEPGIYQAELDKYGSIRIAGDKVSSVASQDRGRIEPLLRRAPMICYLRAEGSAWKVLVKV